MILDTKFMYLKKSALCILKSMQTFLELHPEKEYANFINCIFEQLDAYQGDLKFCIYAQIEE